MAKAHGRILDRRREGFKRQKEDNLDEEHPEKPNQDRDGVHEGPAPHIALLLLEPDPQLGMG